MSIIEREHAVEVPAVTTRDVLHRAADLLEEFGWCQGEPGDKLSGQMCAMGAIWEAAKDLGLDWRGPLSTAACSIMGTSPVGVRWPLARWNDLPWRTKKEVVSLLREAAAA